MSTTLIERLEGAKPSVIEAADQLEPRHWKLALSCGDMIDRLPCKLCGATRLSHCSKPLTPPQIEAARDFINGYGWTAARERAARSDPRPPSLLRRLLALRSRTTITPTGKENGDG